MTELNKLGCEQEIGPNDAEDTEGGQSLAWRRAPALQWLIGVVNDAVVCWTGCLSYQDGMVETSGPIGTKWMNSADKYVNPG